MKSDFEKKGGTFRMVGDYCIPNLTLSLEEEKIKLGKWGMVHKDYLLNHKKALFTMLWVQRMMNIEARAREIVTTELIYA